MTEILQSNFEASIGALENSLKSAIFVALDSEFSGIRSVGGKPSLFDSNEERYVKMKSHISGFSIIQYGLSAFQYDAATNSYSADVYNIYLFPRSMGLGMTELHFQSGAVEFLCRHGFNFNKMVYEGVRYTDSYQETQLRAHMAAGSLLQSLRNDREVDVLDIQHLVCSQVSKWLATAKDGDDLLVTCPDAVLPFLLHYELRISFNNVWTESTTDTKNIRVIKISADARMKLNSEVGIKALNEEAFQYLRGFSRVFSMLSSLAVPVVGHNMLLDLMMSFKQFHKELPDTCKEFKTDLNKLLPSVYDTKLLCFEIKRKLNNSSTGQNRWESSLSKIYEFLKSKRCESIASNPPSITTRAYMQDSPPLDTHLTNPELSSPPHLPKSQLNGADIPCVNGDRSDSSSPENMEIIKANGDDASSSECSTNGVKQKCMRGSSASPGKVNGTEECEKADPDNGTKQEAHFHEAGWDSFCAGFTFLRFAHINAHLQRTDKSKDKPLTWTDLSAALKPYENRIHISMGKFPEMNLSGQDAASKRPPLLHVETRGGKNLDLEFLHAMFAKFGTIDIRPYSRNKAMVQAPTFGCVLDILRGMRNNSLVIVEVYNPIRHSVVVQMMMWSGALLCFAGGFAILAYTGRK